MKEDDRIITSSMREEDLKNEYSLRPKFLNEYIGQDQAKEHISIYIAAAKSRGESLDHALRYIKDRGVAITALQVSSANDSGVYVYSALVRLRPSSNLSPELLMENVSAITGILASDVVDSPKK